MKSTFDDLPVADDNLLALQELLNSKWTYFLNEMDKYNQIRDSSYNDIMVEIMKYVWNEEFQFNAYSSDGSGFGTSQGRYTPREWLEVQDVDSYKALKGTAANCSEWPPHTDRAGGWGVCQTRGISHP